MDRLDRSLGLAHTTLMGVGVILGAGIYALVGKAAGLAGDAVWISFIAAAVVAGFSGLSYAELAAMIPRAGGEYHYVRRAFGAEAAFLTSWLLLVGLGIASAAVALGFGGYMVPLAGGGAVSWAVLLLVASAALLWVGVRESALFAALCTVLEVLGLVVIICIGVPRLGEVELLSAPMGLEGIAAAAALIFFAFIGFEEIVQLAEETTDPARNVPRALLLSIAITTVLYVLVAIAAISVLGWERLGASASPLAEVAEVGAGLSLGTAMAVIALFSTANTVLILQLSSSRLLWGMADDGVLPEALARVSPERRSPSVAIAAVTTAAVVVALALRRIEVIAGLVNVSILATFLIINASVIQLRRVEPDTPRPFRAPGQLGGVPVVPVLGILTVVGLMTQLEPLAMAWGGGAVISGGVVRWLHGARREG